VQQTPHSQQKDAIQLLRGLPAVTISPEEDISLLGSGNVRIFVDGRPYLADAKAFLRTLHGGDIERIEIITNPSAQYSAEGTAGIINFVLRRNQSEGVSGTGIAEVSSLGRGYFDATVKTKRGKWTYEFHTGGRTGTSGRSSYHKLRSTEELPGGPETISTENGGGPNRGKEAEGSAKIAYELDPRSTISAKILGAAARDVSTNHAEFAGLTPDFESFTERQRFSTDLSVVIAELNFDHKGKREGETLNASLHVFGNPKENESNNADFSDGGSLSVDKRKRLLFAQGQVDWQHPMGKGEILSVGGGWDYGRMTERYAFASVGAGGSLGSDVSDQFRGVDNKLAAYATFQQPVGKWTLMPVVRVEHDSRQMTSPGHAVVRIARTDVFPTLHVDRPLSKTVDLTLSYSKRIDRPQLNDLRPYPLVQDVLTIKEGNPHLKDQSTAAYEINLHYHRKKVDAGLIIYDRETSRLWTQVYSAVGDVKVFTFVNAGHSRDRGAEFDVSTPLAYRSLPPWVRRAPAPFATRRTRRWSGTGRTAAGGRGTSRSCSGATTARRRRCSSTTILRASRISRTRTASAAAGH
jgi:outer membrane receptor for ferrienterochelin and colicin